MNTLLLRRWVLVLSAMPLWLVWCASAHSQGRASSVPQTGRLMAPEDLTGYWVALLTEDWRVRMTTPPKGDATGVPLNAEGKRVANFWDPKQDQTPEGVCKAFGAPDLLRVPGRLHITWQDDNTLKLDTDAGTQTRLLHFDTSMPKDSAPSLQGFSAASWQGLREAMNGMERGSTQAARTPEGYLQVITTGLSAGYLRRNGIPYSEKTTLEEYFDRLTEPNGDVYLIVQSIVTDPVYLQRPFVMSTPFKKLADASGWNPTPCKPLPF